jgi:hypothetical protein
MTNWSLSVSSGYVIEAVLHIVLILVVVLSSVGVHHLRDASNAWIPSVDNTACPPLANSECQVGLVVAATNGVHQCTYMNQSTGTACTSQCYAADAETTCTGTDHQCTGSDPTLCLGYCLITEADGNIAQSSHPDCEGKLTFKEYFTPNTTNSSAQPIDWLIYTSNDGDCYPEYGCHWYGTVLNVYMVSPNEVNWVNPSTVGYSCHDLLDMDNDECIQARAITLNGNFSDDIFHEYWSDFESIVDGTSSAYLTRGTFCYYWYKCGVLNETYYEDSQYLIEEKRSVPPVRRALDDRRFDGYLAHLKANSDELTKRFQAHAEQMKRAAAKSG